MATFLQGNMVFIIYDAVYFSFNYILDDITVFGGDLTALCRKQDTHVPKFLLQFLEYIESEGINVVDIYKVPGEESYVTELKSLVEEGISDTYSV